jgi:SAM-dependent methyltransferase
MQISKADLKIILMFGVFAILVTFVSLYFEVYIFAVAVFGFMFVIFLVPHMYGAVWFPSERAVVRKMVDMAGIKDKDVVYDLGSGDGRILIEAWKRKNEWKKRNVRLVGVDISPFAVAVSRTVLRMHGLQDNIEIRKQNLFRTNLTTADVVFAFLTQKTNDRLEQKLKIELKKGTRVVTHLWKFKDMNLVEADEKLKVYLYVA